MLRRSRHQFPEIRFGLSLSSSVFRFFATHHRRRRFADDDAYIGSNTSTTTDDNNSSNNSFQIGGRSYRGNQPPSSKHHHHHHHRSRSNNHNFEDRRNHRRFGNNNGFRPAPPLPEETSYQQPRVVAHSSSTITSSNNTSTPTTRNSNNPEIEKLSSLPEGKHHKFYGIGAINPLSPAFVQKYFKERKIPCFPQFAETNYYLITWLDVPVPKALPTAVTTANNTTAQDAANDELKQQEKEENEEGYLTSTNNTNNSGSPEENQFERYKQCDFIRAVGVCPKKMLPLINHGSAPNFELSTALCWMHAQEIMSQYNNNNNKQLIENNDAIKDKETTVGSDSTTSTPPTATTTPTAFVLKHHVIPKDHSSPYQLPIPVVPKEDSSSFSTTSSYLKNWSKYVSSCAEFTNALFLHRQQQQLLSREQDASPSNFYNYTLNSNPTAESLLYSVFYDESINPSSFHNHQRVADIDHFVLHALEKNGVVTNQHQLSASGNLCYIDRDTRLPYAVTFPIPCNNNEGVKWVCKMIIPPVHTEHSMMKVPEAFLRRKTENQKSPVSSFPEFAHESNSLFPHEKLSLLLTSSTQRQNQTSSDKHHHDHHQQNLFAIGYGETPDRAKVIATLHCLKIVKEKARILRMQKSVLSADRRHKMNQIHLAYQDKLLSSSSSGAGNSNNNNNNSSDTSSQQQQPEDIYIPTKIFPGAKRLITLYSTLMSRDEHNQNNNTATTTPSKDHHNNDETSSNFIPLPKVDTTVTHDKCTTKLTYSGIEVIEHGLSRDESELRAYSALFDIAHQMLPGLAEIEQLCERHTDLATEDIMSAHFDRTTLDKVATIKAQLGEPTKEDLEAEEGKLTPELKMERAALRLHSHLRKDGSRMMSKEERANKMKTKLESMRKSPSYKRYYEESRAKLPMATAKEQLLGLLDKNRVVVICGTTGCGKTTQVPQYLLDHHIGRGEGLECSILVTQPRRISAISISERIAAERCEEVGDSTGYTIRLDSRPGKSVTLLTTGVLLQLLRVDPSLRGVKYLIIDEIHERDLHCDFSLILAKEALALNPDLRLICMSATLQSETFSKYFDKAPIINVDGMLHPVKEIYLEDLPQLAQESEVDLPMFSSDGEYIGNDHHHHSHRRSTSSFHRNHILREKADSLFAAEDEANQQELTAGSDTSSSSSMKMPSPEKIDAHLVASVVELAVQKLPPQTSILVFVPGWKEITQVQNACQRHCPSCHRHDYIFLHSSVTKDQQMMAFRPGAEGRVKIVIATNIAESGVTISDVGAVIDCGLIRQMSCIMRQGTSVVGKDEAGSVFRLRTSWASKANLTQRRGRAGRTQGGLCFRLFTRDHFAKTRDFQTPEILRRPLETVILQSIAMGHGNPEQFFSQALDPPPARLLDHSIRQLRALGAIHDDFKLTWLGQWLVKMPTEPATAKMILLGAMMGCLDPILTIAAAGDAAPMVSSMNLRGEVRKARRNAAMWTLSDHVADAVCVNHYFQEGYPQPHHGKSRLGKGNNNNNNNQNHQEEGKGTKNLSNDENTKKVDNVIVDEDENQSSFSKRLKFSEWRSPSASSFSSSSSSSSSASIPSHLFHRNNLKVLSRYKQQFFDVLASSGWHMDHGGDNDMNTNNTYRPQHFSSSSSSSYFIDYSSSSKHSKEIELIKAIVAAGLYPNVATLSGGSLMGDLLAGQQQAVSPPSAPGENNNSKNKCSLRTKLRSSIAVGAHCVIRPLLKSSRKDLLQYLIASSKNAKEQDEKEQETKSLISSAAASPIFVYENVTDISGQEFVENVTHTNLWALLILAAGDDHILFNKNLNLGIIDGWILFKTDKETIEGLKTIREVLNRCFGRLLRMNYSNKHKHNDDSRNDDNNDLHQTLRVLDQVRDVVKDLICGKK